MLLTGYSGLTNEFRMDQCAVNNQVTHATAVCDGKLQAKISLNNQVCRTTLHERTRKHS